MPDSMTVPASSSFSNLAILPTGFQTAPVQKTSFPSNNLLGGNSMSASQTTTIPSQIATTQLDLLHQQAAQNMGVLPDSFQNNQTASASASQSPAKSPSLAQNGNITPEVAVPPEKKKRSRFPIYVAAVVTILLTPPLISPVLGIAYWVISKLSSKEKNS